MGRLDLPHKDVSDDLSRSTSLRTARSGRSRTKDMYARFVTKYVRHRQLSCSRSIHPS